MQRKNKPKMMIQNVDSVAKERDSEIKLKQAKELLKGKHRTAKDFNNAIKYLTDAITIMYSASFSSC